MLKAAGAVVLLDAWATLRHKSSLVWELMPMATPWGSEGRETGPLEWISGTETSVFLSGLLEDSCKKVTRSETPSYTEFTGENE